MNKISNITKLLLSLPIGIVAAVIAKLVHPDWDILHVSIFGFGVFAITFAISLLVKKGKHKHD